ncbi:MAG: proline dehydrogenase family protein [Candidatus Caenarcaniphilales bacterium]|nr:proline dehydrogenase family protein [Candidatus Caenarcaniphilales bacterium]
MNIDKKLEKEIYKEGLEILKLSKSDFPNLFEKSFWNSKLMELCMKNASFKKQVFHFIDVLPALKTDEQLLKHLEEYFSDDSLGEFLQFFIPGAIRGVAKNKFGKQLLAKTIRANAEEMAKSFIAADSLDKLLPILDDMRAQNLCFTIDLLGEATLSEIEALKKQSEYLILIDKLSKHSEKWKTHNFLDFSGETLIPKVNISIKLSSLYSQISPVNFDSSVIAVKDRLRPILRAAKQSNCFINIDVENYELKDLTIKVFKSILEEEEFSKYRDVGIVIQAYLKSSEADLQELINWCKEKRKEITVRLVKGAYWDSEFILAQQNNWPIPVFTNKSETDLCYEKLTDMLLQNIQYTKPAFASHNIRSLTQAIVKAKRLNISEKEIEFQMLYGMADSIKKSILRKGYRVREYMPIGDLVPGMAYLVRRLLENTSNESFLRVHSVEKASPNKLLESPIKAVEISQKQKEKQEKENRTNLNKPASLLEEEFVNASPVDFSIERNRVAYLSSLENNKKNLGENIPVVINGEEIYHDELFASINPCNPKEVIANAVKANTGHALKALESAFEFQGSWSQTPVKTRAEILLKVSKILQDRRFELSSWETLEVAKQWKEADADVIEAADFCEYYAREAVKLFAGKPLRKVPGESNKYFYRSRGVGIVIAPWNFPLAIPLGMIAAALVTGNTVVFKPSEQSIKTGYLIYQIFREAGCPKEVLHFLPGIGSEIGPSLVNSNKTAFVAFTGSKDVGLEILDNSVKSSESASKIKKVIAEMGGKNALIVDSDADLDEAVKGAIYSAFAFQGQKCSALSRLIVHREIYDEFIDRFKEAMKSIEINDAAFPGAYLSALIDKDAYEQTQRLISETKGVCQFLTQAPLPDKLIEKQGYFIPPTLFEGVPLDSAIMNKELFAPVIVAIKADSISHAVEIANSAPYALTGGVFSRSPRNIKYIEENLEAGNIYVNRSITGAIVSRHPFGGYKLSGIGSKAGGPDYLLQFVNPVTVVENSLRRGYSPDLS